MRAIRYRPDAQRDLDNIWSFIAEHDPMAADKLLNFLKGALLRLIAHPRSAPACPELGSGLRSLSVRQHQLVYRINGQTIEIVRVVDSRRDVKKVVTQGIP